MSVNDPGCVKTPTSNLSVESLSRLYSIRKEPLWQSPSKEEKRENNSAHSLLVHVFTQPGPKSDFVTARPDVRFAAHNGLKSDIAPCPTSATSGLMHRSKIPISSARIGSPAGFLQTEFADPTVLLRRTSAERPRWRRYISRVHCAAGCRAKSSRYCRRLSGRATARGY